jgi:small subunit ribosomal protein S11
MGKNKVAETPEEKKTTTPEGAVASEAKATKSSASGQAPAVSKRSRRIEKGRVYVKASYNNTVVTVTDEQGAVIAWATAGSTGFSGPKKATPFAASKIIGVVAEKMKNAGMSSIDVFVRGIGSGRDSAIRSLINHGFNVSSIKDVTGVPHNGPRPVKVRRV